MCLENAIRDNTEALHQLIKVLSKQPSNAAAEQGVPNRRPSESPPSAAAPTASRQPASQPTESRLPSAAATQAITIDDLGVLGLEFVKRNGGYPAGGEAMRALLADFGVSKISELSEDRYPELASRLKA